MFFSHALYPVIDFLSPLFVQFCDSFLLLLSWNVIHCVGFSSPSPSSNFYVNTLMYSPSNSWSVNLPAYEEMDKEFSDRNDAFVANPNLSFVIRINYTNTSSSLKMHISEYICVVLWKHHKLWFCRAFDPSVRIFTNANNSWISSLKAFLNKYSWCSGKKKCNHTSV